MNNGVQHLSVVLNPRFKSEYATWDCGIQPCERPQVFEFGLTHNRFQSMPKNVLGSEAQQAACITGKLNDLQRAGVDREQDAMRLYGARNVDRLPVAIGEIGSSNFW